MIRVALIGTGGIALANHVPGVALCPEARIVALCDVNPVALERAAQATGVSRTTTDPLEIARDEGVDAVIIATPNRVHHAIALAAIGTGKHVLCEKPIAMTVAEAREHARCGRVGWRRPHDGVHLSLRAGDALPPAPGVERRTR